MKTQEKDYDTFCLFIEKWEELVSSLSEINGEFFEYDASDFINSICAEYTDTILPACEQCRERGEDGGEASFSQRYQYYRQV